MSHNFEVIEADSKDLEGIPLLLKQRSLHPGEKLWQQYCQAMADSWLRRTDGAVPEEISLIVVDKIGVIRGFCTLCQRRHPIYPRLLKVPIIAIEKGPNETEIAQAFFDHLLNFARGQHFDAVLFGNSTRKSWGERTVPDGDTCLGGTLMPLNIDRQRQCEPSKHSNAGSLIPLQFGGRSFDQSRSRRTDVNCSPRRYTRALA